MMRISLGHKLAVVVGLLGLVAVSISAFALRQSEQGQQRAASSEAVWNTALQARILAHAIEHAVVQATAVYTADDIQEAKTRLASLQSALADVEQARVPLLAAGSPTGGATGSRACSGTSKTGGALQHATTVQPATTWPPSPSFLVLSHALE